MHVGMVQHGKVCGACMKARRGGGPPCPLTPLCGGRGGSAAALGLGGAEPRPAPACGEVKEELQEAAIEQEMKHELGEDKVKVGAKEQRWENCVQHSAPSVYQGKREPSACRQDEGG